MVNVPQWSSPVSKAEMVAGDGAEIIEFIQTHCRIDKDTVGGKRGQLLELRPWQQLQIYRLFARRPDGRRKHRVGLMGLPRKNGKSALGSSIALAEADMGPHGGEIYCCAGDREQARIVFSTARQMVEMDPHLSGRVKVYKNEMIWTQTETRFKVLSAEAYTKEGLNPTFVIFDEVHVQPNDDLWDVMALAMGAREEPMMIGITTAGDPTDRFGNDTLAYRYYQHGQKVAAGELSDSSFYFAWWEPPESADHTDPETWRISNPGFGDLVLEEDFESSVVRTAEAEFRTKRCNLWVVGKMAAVPAGKWQALEQQRPASAASIKFQSGITVPADWLTDAVLFLDGSWSGDSTGVVGCTRDGYLYPITHHEKQQTDGPDWRVPVTSVEEDIRTAIDNGARGLILDPHLWQRTAAVLRDEGYPVLEWPTNSLERIVPAWKDWFNAIMDGGDGIAHNGHPALARHVANITLKDQGNRARPVKQSSGRKIDLAICAIGAWVNREVDFAPEKKRARMWSAVA